MMRWVMLAILLVAAVLFALGHLQDRDSSQARSDAAIGASIFYLLAMVAVGLDLLLLWAYALWRLLA